MSDRIEFQPAGQKAGLSRRRLIGTGGALLLGGGLAGLGSSEARAAKTGTAASAAGKPTRGGTMTYAAVGGLPGFDPARWWNGFVWTGVLAVFDSLLIARPDGTLGAGILHVPKITKSGRLYTFKVRSGVKFHHGRTMTADDVKFTLDRLLAPATKSEGISLYNKLPIVGLAAVLNEKAKSVSGIKAVGKDTVTIELERPESALAYVLTLPFAAVVPRDVVEAKPKAFGTAPVGTGPFRMKDVNLDKGLTLERFEGYWNQPKPYLDRVEWSFGLDAKLAVLRIEDNKLDMMMPALPVGELDHIRNDPDLSKRLVQGADGLAYYMTLNVRHKPLDDVRVRKAIAMAIDRDRLVRILKGLPKAATGGVFSPLSPYYQDGLALPHDPDGAKRLLAEAGFENGFDTEIFGQTDSPFAEMSQATQADLKAVGIRAKTSLVASQVFVTKAYSAKPPAIVPYLWDLPYPHGSYLMDGAFTKAAVASNCCNLSSYESDAFEKLARNAHESTNPKVVVKDYKAMDRQVVQKDAVAVPMFYEVRTGLISKRLKGFKIPTTLSSVDFMADYWLASS